MNSYAYADENPVNLADPTGRDAAVESATLYRYVLVYTAATILYYERQAVWSAVNAAYCWNRWILDMQVCEAIYHNDPVALANCYAAARAKRDYCLGKTGPTQ